jgi:coproporphyrinogen III oxidase-like Fe-S oxidoreductase
LQALHSEALHFLGRAHDVDEGLAALSVAQRHFGRVNFDLIYARPGQSEAEWEAELRRALALGTSHLSLYQLTIEPGTRFETLVREGKFQPVDPDQGALLFELTQTITSAAGLPAYEVSNHAREGEQSRHNLTYWRYGDYVGIGPGAHGRRQGLATVRHRKPENWMKAILRKGDGLESEALLSPSERAREALVMGLRLAEGIDPAALAARTGVDSLIDPAQLPMLQNEGLISQTGPRLTVTPKGMLLLDAILVSLVAA